MVKRSNLKSCGLNTKEDDLTQPVLVDVLLTDFQQ
jgi:hypothetical protein